MGVGLDYIVKTPLLLSHCGFFFAFGCKIFLVDSKFFLFFFLIFLCMGVQHLVQLLLGKGASSSPNLPPCLDSSSCFHLGCLQMLPSVCPGHYSFDVGCAGVAASPCSPEGIHMPAFESVSGGAA